MTQRALCRLLVREYLQEMEVPNFYIEAMMAKNSQDAYIVTSDDDVKYRLNGYAPSIEEITLTKCKPLTDEQCRAMVLLARKGNRRNPEENSLFESLLAKSDSGSYCQRDVMKQVRADAFTREFLGAPR